MTDPLIHHEWIRPLEFAAKSREVDVHDCLEKAGEHLLASKLPTLVNLARHDAKLRRYLQSLLMLIESLAINDEQEEQR